MLLLVVNIVWATLLSFSSIFTVDKKHVFNIKKKQKIRFIYLDQITFLNSILANIPVINYFVFTNVLLLFI